MAERDAAALLKLIRLARSRTDETAARLETLRASLASVDAALDLLVGALAEEAAAAKAAEIVGFVHLAGYLAGANLKRAALEATRQQIVGEIVAGEAALREAFAELKKLEHLADRVRLDLERCRRRRENAQIDDLARALSRRAQR